MELKERLTRLRPVMFAVASLFVYAGSVNYGGFDFLPAIPFLIFVLYSAVKWRWHYTLACIILAFVCIPLYVLKKNHGILFHPSLGREFTTTENTCLTVYNVSGEQFILLSELIENKCDSSNLGQAVKWELFPKDSKLVVEAISVSNADFGESYVIHSKVPLGPTKIYGTKRFLAWIDGKQIEQSDLRRAVFFYPSLLMYWPMLPYFLLSLPGLLFR